MVIIRTPEGKNLCTLSIDSIQAIIQAMDQILRSRHSNPVGIAVSFKDLIWKQEIGTATFQVTKYFRKHGAQTPGEEIIDEKFIFENVPLVEGS